MKVFTTLLILSSSTIFDALAAPTVQEQSVQSNHQQYSVQATDTRKFTCTQKWFGTAPLCGKNEECPSGWYKVRKDMVGSTCDATTTYKIIKCQDASDNRCLGFWGGNKLLCERCQLDVKE
ncbi:hypothetical protein TWF694_008903 [Orbilia ellipsospora]|uniref:Secreted protein n=1 Tax=Orbilia ellipsospora TaxID=2528407 RepID=A0AAV9XDU3_9PEZI